MLIVLRDHLKIFFCVFMQPSSEMLHNINTDSCHGPIFKIIVVEKKLNMTAPKHILVERGSFRKFPGKLSNKIILDRFSASYSCMSKEI